MTVHKSIRESLKLTHSWNTHQTCILLIYRTWNVPCSLTTLDWQLSSFLTGALISQTCVAIYIHPHNNAILEQKIFVRIIKSICQHTHWNIVTFQWVRNTIQSTCFDWNFRFTQCHSSEYILFLHVYCMWFLPMLTW
jgi:hypothetical protein